ncbi:hypothetical protein [Acidovorax sp.]|uniref:hypothetical protein n=1 Tax=Acidovorax sp. TaxID=1872122 RepID=UPI002ACDF4F9|nr:hypothetical protein [Acidovorax sp.]MDZ7861900.1 hypothetical protein [Acidovorax sp.]
MQALTVLKKTDQGIEAIKHRDRALAPRERTILILVDGSKRLQDLAQACGSLDEALRIGQALVDLGTGIGGKPGGAAPPSPTTAAASDAPAAATAAAPPQDLRSSTRRATKALEDLLGPACEPLALQLEKCKSMAELQAKILELRTVVASMRSEKKAEEFVATALGR